MKNTNKKRIFWILVAAMALLNIGEINASEITPKKVIELVNTDRSRDGANKLAENIILNKAASDKAEDMIKNKYFAHVSPSGIDPWFWFEKNEYEYKYAGENLAIDFKNAERQQKAWMNSEKHRKNILNDKYTEIGVAVKQGNINGHESTVVVQLFGSRDGVTVPNEAAEKIMDKSDVLGVESSISEETINNNIEIPSGIINGVKNMHIELYQLISLALAVSFGYAWLIFLSYKRHNMDHVEVKKLYTVDLNNYENFLNMDDLIEESKNMQPVYVTSQMKR